MSTDNRERALAAAISFADNGACTSADIIGFANVFLAFLNGDKALDSPKADAPTATPKSADGAKPAKTPTAVKAAAKTPETPVTKAADTASDEAVGKAIGAMLSANLKAECKALLAKFGATNKSTLKAEHFADFVSEANDFLMAE